jgi:hypothetical protein
MHCGVIVENAANIGLKNGSLTRQPDPIAGVSNGLS